VRAVEKVEVVVGCGPDTAGSVLIDVDDQAFLNAIGSAEAMKLCTIVTKESIFGGSPE
jgi:hypothetical protein